MAAEILAAFSSGHSIVGPLIFDLRADFNPMISWPSTFSLISMPKVQTMTDKQLTRSFTLTVRYAETDAQGVVHHANYLIWFEEGRSELLRQQGFYYSDLEREGYFVIVAQATVDYRAPSFYEDRITVATTFKKGKGRLLEFSYRATNQDDVLVAEGRTRHLVLDAERHLVSLPDRYLQFLSGEGL